MIRVLELFAGIGACSTALKRLGYDVEVVDAVEIDEHAMSSFNAIHGTNFEPQDISKWDKDVGQIDLLMHGSPCTNFSLAGRQEGGDEGSGTASSLMYETLRIVEKIKPRIVIWENVANLLSDQHFHNFSNYIVRMGDLGYASAYKVLNTKDYGIPQNRERVFTISVLGGATIDLFGYELDFEFPKPIPLKLHLKDVLDDEVDSKYYLTEKKIGSILKWKAFQKPFESVLGNESVSPTLTARGAGEDHSGMVIFSPQLDNTTSLQDELLEMYGDKTKEGLLD